MDKFKIGYFSSLKIEDQYIGGIMVTDMNSIPVEFKYTEPINPTKIHRIIFGKVLEKYISEEVIKKNLFREIKSLPAVVLVSQLELLSVDSIHSLPIVAIQDTTLPGLEKSGQFQRVKEKEVIVQPLTSKNPLKLTFFTADPEIQEKTLNVLKSFIERIDLTEPFARIETALKTLCLKQD